MPIFMDRHDVAEKVTAEIVAEIHQEDLRIQHEYSCRGITYWYDDHRKTAFCLIEAPNKEAITEMHAKAHGEVPNTIIEVDASIVESFLGRIEDPAKSQKKELNIVNNPAFRILIVLKLVENGLPILPKKELFKAIHTIIEQFEGRLVNQHKNYLLISFTSTTKAINAAIAIKIDFSNSKRDCLHLCLGVSAGVPFTKQQPGLFQETIKTAERLCAIATKRIVITTEVKELYESENLNVPINEDFIQVLSLPDEEFLANLNNFMEKEWQNGSLKVANFCASLGFSTSQLYRKMTSLMKKSTNTIILDFRLKKALELLQKKDKTISEIAFDTGFNSPAYFSQCFQKKYHLLPSKYRKMR